MANQAQDTLQRLEALARQLILQDKNLQERCRELEGQVAKCNAKIEELVQKNGKLSTQYANLKVARMLELSDSDTRNARQRLSHLVREVDKCIALLKA